MRNFGFGTVISRIFSKSYTVYASDFLSAFLIKSMLQFLVKALIYQKPAFLSVIPKLKMPKTSNFLIFDHRLNCGFDDKSKMSSNVYSGSARAVNISDLPKFLFSIVHLKTLFPSSPITAGSVLFGHFCDFSQIFLGFFLKTASLRGMKNLMIMLFVHLVVSNPLLHRVEKRKIVIVPRNYDYFSLRPSNVDSEEADSDDYEDYLPQDYSD